ncbi:MAG: tetratricopeptide repeat protein [Candidatus Wallbacteria bacterium]|nr:tetratricopeptide repeat protein [Candidatus Wallbacteria bacterium]
MRFFLLIFLAWITPLLSGTGTSELTAATGAGRVLMDEGRRYFDAGEVGLAISSFDAALREYPDLAEAHLELGRIFFYRDQFAKALRHFKAYEALTGQEREIKFYLDKIYRLAGSTIDLTSEIQAGSRAKVESMVLPSLPKVTKTVSDTSEDAGSPGATDASLWKKAQDYIQSGKTERAYYTLKVLVRQFSDESLPRDEIFLQAAKYAALLGHKSDTSYPLEKMMTFTKNIDAYKMLAQVYLDSGKLDQASTVLEKALKIAPDNIEVRGNLALYYRKQGEPHKAVNHLLTVLKQDPENVLANYNLALIYFENGKFDEAQNLINKIKKTLPPKNNVYQQSLILERKIEQCRSAQ